MFGRKKKTFEFNLNKGMLTSGAVHYLLWEFSQERLALCLYTQSSIRYFFSKLMVETSLPSSAAITVRHNRWENVSSFACYTSVTSVATQETNQLPGLEHRRAKGELQ